MFNKNKNNNMILISAENKKTSGIVSINHNKKQHCMKKYNFIIALCILTFSFFSCTEEEENKREMGDWDSGPITEYTVNPIYGGAIIEYTIPKDRDILYIMAEYERNGKPYQVKSSVHENALTIEGFHKQDKVTAKIYKVNRKEQKSRPITIEFEPKESLIDIAINSIKFDTGYGGIGVNWENPNETELGLTLFVQNENKEMIDSILFYSSALEGFHSFRGFEPVETTFGFRFEDKWGNLSDTIEYFTLPLYETQIPKPYADYRSFIPYDNTTNYDAARTFIRLWDNIVHTAGHGWLTVAGNPGLSMTIDMQQVAKLTRIIIHGYHINEPYYQANITEFEAWGIDKIDKARYADKDYWLDEESLRYGALVGAGVLASHPLPDRTFKDDWVYLGRHPITYYSNPDDIIRQSQEGTEYRMPDEATPVRYIRFFIRDIATHAPSGSNYWSMGEITFFGDNTMEQTK